METVRMRAGSLVRRGWRATIVLAVLGGIAGGVAMAAWASGRRASSAFDRFLAFANPPDLIVTFCPPELTAIDESSLLECFSYDPVGELAEIARLPQVEVAARVEYRGVSAARPERPDDTWIAGAVLLRDPGVRGAEGATMVVEGRHYEAGNEVVINERFRDRTGVGVGDELLLTFTGRDEMGASIGDGQSYHGPSASARVVGVVRGLRDIGAAIESADAQDDELQLTGGPALAQATPGAGIFGGVLVVARDDADSAGAAIEAAFAPRPFNLAPHVGAAEIEPIADAIRYEARAVLVFAAVAAMAATVFVGQAVARQSRREWIDGDTLRALGLSNRDAGASAALRGLVIGAIAAAIAVVAGVLLSGVAATAVARRAEVEPGPVLDALVLVTGAVLVVAMVTAAAWFPVARQFARSRRHASQAVSRGRGPVQSWLGPSAAAGAGITLTGGRGGRALPTGAALASVAAAMAGVVAAVGLIRSMDGLQRSPEQFGVTWDLSIPGGLDGATRDPLDGALEAIASDPAVEAAAGIVGTDVSIGADVEWVHAFEPLPGVDGVVSPVITAGRAPAAIDEIALGSITMAARDLTIGDTVDIAHTVSGSASMRMTVVGTTIINDTFEESPGRGGVVTPAWIERFAPEVSPGPYVVRLAQGADAEQFQAELQRRFGVPVDGPVQQGAIRNVARIRQVPVLLAAVVVVLAMASFAHALVLTVRRQRSTLAVLKSLGFQRRHVRAVVAWHATFLAAFAAAVGVPLGIIAGRWGWRLIAERLGVAAGPVTPLVAVWLAVAGALVLANAIASYPGWRASRVPIAEALRAE
jgi:FtsX-like permease family